MEDNEIKTIFNRFRFQIIGLLICLLIFLSFYFGAIYSCKDSYLKNFRCIEPQKVATVKVCEYNPYSCVANCQDFIVEDVNLFCNEYANKE